MKFKANPNPTNSEMDSKTIIKNVGKQVPIFFPYYELSLIEDLDYQAHLEFSNRSNYVRGLIKKDKQRVKEQSQPIKSSDEKFYAQRDANFKNRVKGILFNDDSSGHSDEEVLELITQLKVEDSQVSNLMKEDITPDQRNELIQQFVELQVDNMDPQTLVEFVTDFLRRPIK